MALSGSPGVAAVYGGWGTVPSSPAAFVEGGLEELASGSASWALSAAAEGTEVLVLMLVGAPGGAINRVMINGGAGGPSPTPLVFNEAAGGSECVAWVFHLRVGDAYVAVQTTAGTTRALCWAVIDDTNLVPTDWELFVRTRTAGNTVRTSFWDALDTGVVLGAAVVVNGDATDMTEPYQWTFVDEVIGDALTVNFAYSDVWFDGTQPPDAWAGAIPADATGEAYWFGAYDIGLRLRDAGSWSNGGGLGVVTAGPSEPTARQFPPDPTIPNLPPEPSGIVLPTPPWIPPDGGGPFRPS